jgi:hypothetical protein
MGSCWDRARRHLSTTATTTARRCSLGSHLPANATYLWANGTTDRLVIVPLEYVVGATPDTFRREAAQLEMVWAQRLRSRPPPRQPTRP